MGLDFPGLEPQSNLFQVAGKHALSRTIIPSGRRKFILQHGDSYVRDPGLGSSLANARRASLHGRKRPNSRTW